MRLYSGPMSMFGAKAHSAALEKGIDIDVVMVPYSMRERYEPKHPDVIRINPKRQVPVLVDGDLRIFDSTQIFEYLEDRVPIPRLWPVDPAERARARQLEHCSDEVFFPHIIRLMGGPTALTADEARVSKAAAAAYYRQMDALLTGSEYLAGDFTFADIAFYMAQLFGEMLGARMTAEAPALLAWRDRLTSRPAVERVVSPIATFMSANGLRVPTFLQPLMPAATDPALPTRGNVRHRAGEG